MKSSPINGWTVQSELLAQLIEEVSLLASDRRRDKPRTVHRPYGPSAVAPSNGPVAQQARPPMSGHRAMLAAAARRGMVRSGG
ncbi:hypothetical protein ACFYZ9_33425 [Streptomyces sp. NPDC001691]|uniref:hypothetical protein n=1 Tax=Streptomyces sp. NPDC001691 TaxID=3364600 RepID=UPI00368DC665